MGGGCRNQGWDRVAHGWQKVRRNYKNVESEEVCSRHSAVELEMRLRLKMEEKKE